MRTKVFGVFAAATLAAATFIAGLLPCSAQVARPLSALAVGDSDDGIVTLVRRGGGGGGGGGMRMGGGGGMHMAGGFHRGGRIALADRGAGIGSVHRGDFARGHAGRQVALHNNDRHHGRHRHHHHHHHGNGWWWGTGAAALGWGLGYGAAYGYPYYGYYDSYYDPYYYTGAECIRRVRVYNRATGTYVIRNITVACV